MKTILRSVVGCPPLLFLRRLRTDSTLGLDAQARNVLGAMKRHSSRSVYGDRYDELRDYWGKSHGAMAAFFLQYGWPFSRRLHQTLNRRFDGRTAPGELLHAYRDAAFHYATLLMLSMHRGEWLAPFLADIVGAVGRRTPWRVLDYGGGVSDMGVALAQAGAEVTLVDLDDSKLAFAQWRYAQRGLTCRAIPVRDAERFPPVPDDTYDLVIATEILEHVRNPLELLVLLTMALRARGLLFCTLEHGFDREVGGDHLAEAITIGQSAPYREYFQRHYKLFADRGGRPWLFQRT